MLTRLLPWIRFLRLPAVFTVPGDVWVGAALMGIGCPWNLWVSVCLAYLYGMALNDVLDAPKDRLHRPERPIPSGDIHKTAAVVVCFSFAILAFLLHPGGSVLFLLVLISAYNLLKDRSLWLGAFLMASCRCAVLWVGAGAPGALRDLWSLFLLWGSIIFLITFLADKEGREFAWGKGVSWILTALWMLAPLLALRLGSPRFLLFLPWLLLMVLGLQNIRQINRAGRIHARNTGKWLGMLIPLQAVFLFAFAPVVQGVLILALWPCLQVSVRKLQIS